MTAKLNIRIDRGNLPRTSVLNKKLDLILDDETIGRGLSWGDKRSFKIPAGRHTLTLKHRPFDICYSLDFMAENGGTVDIDSLMDMKKGTFTLFNSLEGTSSAGHPGTTTLDESKKIGKAYRENLFVGFCASAGIALFYILKIIASGLIPGGFIPIFIGTVIAGLLGAAVGKGIIALRRK